MKPVFISFLFLCIWFGANSQTIGHQTPRKPVKSKHYYYSDGGFCSSSIYLNDDSTFWRESGCEGNSIVTCGYWLNLGDSIRFTSLNRNDIRVRVDIIPNPKPKKDEEPIRIEDMTGFVISPLTIRGIKNEATDTLHHDFIYMQSNFVPVLTEDIILGAANQISSYDSIEVLALTAILGKPFRIPGYMLKGPVRVIFQVNGQVIFYNKYKYEFWEKPQILKFTGKSIGKFKLSKD